MDYSIHGAKSNPNRSEESLKLGESYDGATYIMIDGNKTIEILLFPETYEQKAKKPHPKSTNMSGIAIVDIVTDPTKEVTVPQFKAWAGVELGKLQSGREIILNQQQVKLARLTFFPEYY